MPTLQQWVNALAIPRHITIESSQALLDSVREKQAQRNARLRASGRSPALKKDQLEVVQRFAPSRTVPLRPIDLLHRLGVITTPVVPNLADISSWWAYIRYLWAFELPDGTSDDRLRLSDAALGIDVHQKRLMSDQIGVGMAALIMKLYFDAPGASDVAVALNEQVLPVDLTEATSPDYLFWNAEQTAYYVVECKGTRCPRSVALDQLRRGTEQVPSLRFTDGRQPPTALVIGTRLTGNGTEVMIIDPPPDEEGPKGVIKLGSNKWEISDPKEFQRVTGMVSELKILGYAAADQAAEDIVREKWTRIAEAWPTRRRRTVVRENTFGEFSGVQQTLPFLDDVHVEVFQGIGRGVLAGHLKHDDAIVRAEREELLDRIQAYADDPEHREQFGFQKTENTDGIGVLSVSSDGTILEIRLAAA
ncbi:MAG: hypothetical protein OXH92_10770 [Bryobacterales bacterium]|nr:hypothetical protein [Bryobacterales bacterium]